MAFRTGDGWSLLADWGEEGGWDPCKSEEFANLIARFPHFQDEWRRGRRRGLVPKISGPTHNIFETGGTTGMPKQRIGWDDYETDYEEFSERSRTNIFPRGGAWLMLADGPRRLRLAIEHLVNYRGSVLFLH